MKFRPAVPGILNSRFSFRWPGWESDWTEMESQDRSGGLT